MHFLAGVSIWFLFSGATSLAKEADKPDGGLSLKEFSARALPADVGLRSVELQGSLAGERLGAARSRYFPRLVPQFSYSQTENGTDLREKGLSVSWPTAWGFRFEAGSLEARQSNGLSAEVGTLRTDSASITIPIGAGAGRLPAKIVLEDARQRAVQEQRDLSAARGAALLEIIAAYFEHRRAELEQVAARAAIERANRTTEYSELRFRMGEVARIDVDRSRQRLQAARAEELRARSNLRRVAAQIGARYEIEEFTTLGSDDPELERYEISWTADELTAIALAADPRLTNARERIALLEMSRRLADRNLLPAVDLTWSQLRFRGEGSGDDEGAWGDAFRVTTDLSLDYADRRLARAQAEADLEIARLEVRRLEQDLRASVIADLDNFQRRAEAVELGRQSLQTARDQLEVAEIRFRRGIGSAFDVVESQEQLQGADQQLIGATIDFVIAYYALLQRLQLLELDQILD